MENLGVLFFTGLFLFIIYYAIKYIVESIDKHNASKVATEGGLLVVFSKLTNILVAKGYRLSDDSFTKVQFTKDYYPYGRALFIVEKTNMADRPYSIDYHIERSAFGKSKANSETFYMEPHFKEEAYSEIVKRLEMSLPPIIVEDAVRVPKQPKEVSNILYEHMIKQAGLNTIDSFIGIGEFGLVETNPIPTRTVFGNDEYLNKLRTDKGKSITYSRKGTVMIKNLHTPIDRYSIYVSKVEIAELYLCPYARETATLAPKGFKLNS